MISRISITHDPALDGRGHTVASPVEIELKDGTVLSATGRVRGGSESPIPAEEVVAKFRKVTARQIPNERQDEIIAQCNRLETLGDASSLFALLQA